ncbi:MAG TPA: TetR/AcrR family transcriptional regulator [Solirubrobacteraceae bacterium]
MSAARVERTERPARRRRSDGERSRSAILREAAQLATVEGIGGLSIARLADAVGMSKSGLFAHFGSKEELQLATIEAANVLFNEHVVEPASAADTGLGRLRGLAEGFLRHLENDVFAGGCFFASVAAEMDTHPGPVRDMAVEVVEEWLQGLEQAIGDAQSDGEIDRDEDPLQLAFELNAFLLLANAQFVISRQSLSVERARRAVEGRLAAALSS